MIQQKLLLAIFLFVVFQVTIIQAQQKNNAFTLEAFENKLKEAGDRAQILDARSREEFHKNHLKNAIDFSAKDEKELQVLIDQLKKNQPVFVYSIGNGRSTQLAKKLKEQNFTEVYDLPGGLSRWIGSGRGVESTVASGYSKVEYEQLINSDKLVLVDVSSRYCGGCKKLAPIVDSIANENSSSLKLIKIEFFENKNLAQELDVQAIPHLILYKGKKIVWQKAGVTPKSEIQAAIAKQDRVN